jgi:hypothetical protein
MNFVEACPLNSHLFAALPEEVLADHKLLLWHSQVK